MAITQDLDTLKINYLTQEQYNIAQANGQINANELYLTPNTTGELIVSSEDASNPAAYPQNSIWLKYGDIAGGQADWIVEWGTSGIWTYRKWYSGIAECWGQWTGTITNYGTVGTFYGYNVDINLPTGLFISTEEPICTFACRIGSGHAWPSTNLTTSYTKVRPYMVATTSGSQSTVINLSVKGHWK